MILSRLPRSDASRLALYDAGHTILRTYTSPTPMQTVSFKGDAPYSASNTPVGAGPIEDPMRVTGIEEWFIST